jgi:Fic family protein
MPGYFGQTDLWFNRWKPIFANLPVESLVHTHQPEYYAALNQSSELADCAPFIEFMLEIIRETLAATAEQDTSRLESKLATRIVLLLQKNPSAKRQCLKPSAIKPFRANSTNK